MAAVAVRWSGLSRIAHRRQRLERDGLNCRILAVDNLSIRRGIEFWIDEEKSHHRPDFVIALLRGPGWHPREFNAMLDHIKEFIRFQFGDRRRQVGRMGGHVLRHSRQRGARTAVTRAATRFVMACTLQHQVWIIEVGGFQSQALGGKRPSHGKFQQPCGDRPVAGAGLDRHQPGCGEEEATHGKRHEPACDFEPSMFHPRPLDAMAGVRSSFAVSPRPPAR